MDAPAPAGVGPLAHFLDMLPTLAPDSVLPETEAASGSCAACGNRLGGPYCSACGERAARPEDESLPAFLREQFSEVTSADGKLWRTVKALFVPGKLTAEYLDGRRSLYVRPIRIFLVLNVLLFFALSGSEGTILKGPLQTHFGAVVYGDVARTLAASKAVQWDAAIVEARTAGVPEAISNPSRTAVPDYETAFDAHAKALAPSLVGVLIPGFVLLLAVLLWPARASGIRHVVFATHLVAAMVALAFVLMISLEAALNIARRVWNSPLWADSMDPILIPLTLLAFVTYIGAAVRRVYGVPLWASAAAGLFLGTAGFAFAFWCFRLTLFVVTYWTLDPPV